MIEIAAILSAVVRHWEDFIMIFFMLALNAVVGFWEEFKADNEIEALKKHLALHSRVLRDGKWSDVEAKTLVSGDIVMVKLGNVIPADSEAGRWRLPQHRSVGADGRVTAGRQEEKRRRVFRIDRAHGPDEWAGRRHRNEHALRPHRDNWSRAFKTVSHFQKAVLKIGNFLILITLGLVALILTVSLFRGDPLVRNPALCTDSYRSCNPGRLAGRPVRHDGRRRIRAR